MTKYTYSNKHRRATQLVAATATLCLGTLSSCSVGKFAVKPAFSLSGERKHSADLKIDTAYVYSQEEHTKHPSRIYYLSEYNTRVGEDKMRVRNEIIYEILAIIEEEHAYNFDQIRRARGHAKFSSHLINVGTHIATAASPGAEAVQVLAAIGAGASTLDESIDSSYLQEATLRSIFAAIENEKLRLRALLKTDLLRDTTEYPLQAGFADLKRYWEVGFIHRGIALVELSVNKDLIKAKEGENAGAADDLDQGNSGNKKAPGAEGNTTKPTGTGKVKTENRAAGILRSPLTS